MDRTVVKRRGAGKNSGGGRQNKRGGRGRGRGDVGRGRGGWSASRKGGFDLDDTLDGPVVSGGFDNEFERGSSSSSRNAASSRGRSSHSRYAGSGRGSSSTFSTSAESASPVQRPQSKVKVEMQRLYMSQENQDMLRQTLLSIQGRDLDGEYQDEIAGLSKEDTYEDVEYDELDYRTEDQYWMSDRKLVLEEVKTFHDKKSDVYNDRNVRHEFAVIPENSFAISKLQRCGFSSELCQEALQLCDGDTGAALEYLLNDLFSITLNITDDASDVEVEDPQILEERLEEKMALESIFDTTFQELIPNRVWNIQPDLPELSELIKARSQVTSTHAKKENKSKDKKKLCPFFLKGSCKFRERCRLSHSVVDSRGEEQSGDLSHPIYANLKALEDEAKKPFSIEIRFPEGNRYPKEPPLVAFSCNIPELPPHSRLSIAQFLMTQAREAAEAELPCVFTLVSSLEDREKLEELLSLPPPAQGKPATIHTPSTNHESTPNLFSELKPCDKILPSVSLCRESVNSKPENSMQSNKLDGYTNGSKRKKDFAPVKLNPLELRRQNRALQEDFRKKQGSKSYQNMQCQRQRLPAWDMRDLVTEVIRDNQVVVISGMTGCGKTTQVPQFLLDEAMQQDDFNANIVCTQPRRISAMAVAQRVADERCEKLGKSVGYQIRLESVMSPQTRLLFCTTGIILRRLEGDPLLDTVTHIIIDEVHERSEESDFLMMILQDVLAQRPDLKVILMSATVNAELFSDYFSECPVLEIPGRTFPVQQLFIEDIIELTDYRLEENSPYARPLKRTNAVPNYSDLRNRGGDSEVSEFRLYGSSSEAASDKILDMNLTPKQMRIRYPDYRDITLKTLSTLDLDKINYDLIVMLLEFIVLGNHEFPSEGAILVFLPGYAEIQTLYDQLLATSEFGMRNKGRYKIIPLHSTLSSEDQNAVFRKPPDGIVKIVIATNIAETSITIDDVVFVVDAGRMKEKRYDQAKSMESLETVWVSRANALQRRGRAGRVKEGVSFHLFSSHHFKFHLREQPIPEIQRAPLEQLVLKIKMLPIFSDQDVQSVLEQLIEAPSEEAILGAMKRLQDLGAVDEIGELTPLGYHLGSLPVDVRIGKLMLFGAIFRCLDATLTVAAMLSFKSPFVAPFGLKQEADEKRKEFAMGNSDYLTMLNAYKGWTEAKERGHHKAYLFCQENFLSIKTLQMLASLKQQYVELLSDIGFIRRGIRKRDVERAGRGGSDGVAEITGLEGNVNSNNWKLLSAMLVAALYPNIVQVLTPDTRYHASSTGAVVRAPTAEEIKFKTKLDGYVHIHPSSVNFQVRHYHSPYLVFHEKVKTSKVYLRDCSMVTVYPLLLFGGGNISIDLYQGNFILSVDDGWIKFMASCPQVAELLRELRREMDQLLEDKICQPEMDLLTCPRGSKIINCIVTLISSQ